MVILFTLLVLAEVPVLESQLITPSGKLERLRSRDDERVFSVKLTREDGTTTWLEKADQIFLRSQEKIRREVVDDSKVAVMLESLGQKTILGFSRRVFHKQKLAEEKTCESIARVGLPTALDRATDLLLSKLNCDDHHAPLTETSDFQVLGRANRSWVSCDKSSEGPVCLWAYPRNEKSEAAAQVSALSFLWTAQQEFLLHRLNPLMKPVKAKSWASHADNSTYDAVRRTLFFGEGHFLDALDGFVVVHEWTHAVTDDLNPGLYGYESDVLHEGISDFVAAATFNSPCFAPYDAQEKPNQTCVRDLRNRKTYPQDMTGDDPHLDGEVLSGALWEAKTILPAGLTLEVTLESLIRLNKDSKLRVFWKKFMSVYRRILDERPALKNQEAELSEIAGRRGLL